MSNASTTDSSDGCEGNGVRPCSRPPACERTVADGPVSWVVVVADESPEHEQAVAKSAKVITAAVARLGRSIVFHSVRSEVRVDPQVPRVVDACCLPFPVPRRYRFEHDVVLSVPSVVVLWEPDHPSLASYH